MKTLSKDLIQELLDLTNQNISKVENFKTLTPEVLNQKTNHESWSILECIEHLNLYGDFYVPEIGNQINASNSTSAEIFKSGWLGNYFAKSMLPKEKLNKMKTFTSMNPSGSELSKKTLDKFINHQNTLLELLDKSKEVNLSKTKTSISISKFIKLRLGDTFRVVIYHNLRHIVQAENVFKSISD